MYEYKVKEIVSIYDGDTCKLILDLGFNISSMQTIRLLGINAPELRGDERPQGIISRDWLRDRLFSSWDNEQEIIIKTTKDKSGKYGRLLGTIIIEGVNINELMIKDGLAEVY